TATVEARVPAAPLTPQKQAVGLRSIAEISSIPVGNPKPSNKPAGAIVTTYNIALDNRLALSNARNTPIANGEALRRRLLLTVPTSKILARYPAEGRRKRSFRFLLPIST